MSAAIRKGDVICNRTITEVLSAGQHVFWWAKAIHDSTGEKVVLQVLNPDVSDRQLIERLQEYFERDLRKPVGGGSLRLQLPEQTLSEPGYPFVAVYRETDLQPLLNTKGAGKYWEEALDCLKALHRHDVVHGALSLERFAVDKKRDCFLLKEFGFAPLLQGGVKNALDDCRACLAPEVARGHDLTKEADIYGFARALAAWDPSAKRQDWYRKATDPVPTNRYAIREFSDVVKRFIVDREDEPLPCQLIVRANPPEAGEVTGGGEHPQGARVEVRATPKPGWVFDKWSGDVGGTRNGTTMTLDGKKEVTAHFRKEAPPRARPASKIGFKHSLTVEVDKACRKGGEVVVRRNGGVTSEKAFPEGTAVEITAVPQPFWRFDHWSGDTSGSTTSVSVKMDGDKTVTDSFAEVPHAFLSGTVKPRKAGAVEGEGSHPKGKTVEVLASPAPDWVFHHWSGSLSGADNPARLTLDGDRQVVAHFIRAGHSGPEEVTSRKPWSKAFLLSCGSPWTVLPLLVGYTDLVVLRVVLGIESEIAFFVGVGFLLASLGALLTQFAVLLSKDVAPEE